MDACGPISQMRVRNKWLQHPAVVLWLATSCSFAVVSAQDRCSVNVPCQFNGSCDTNTGYCACMLGYGGAKLISKFHSQADRCLSHYGS